MKSSSGQYYIGLDHVRAVAAFLVFTWHFVHVNNGQHASPPLFPLSLLAEGHTGVALFMALSGYLFAKLLDGKKINYALFIWNRILRLAPLMVVVILIVGAQHYYSEGTLTGYVKRIIVGVIKPSLPNGGWSITVEFHFYLALPCLLLIARRSKHFLVVAVLAAVLFRVLLYQERGEIQSLAYWTIIGRIDQFLLGMIAYNYRDAITGRHLLAAVAFVIFAGLYWSFDSLGGFYDYPSYPSPSPLWILLPAVEGAIYGLLISWYDGSFVHSSGRLSRFVALIGTYSYSIYLLHYFVVFNVADFISAHVIELSNIYLAILLSPVAFLVMIPLGHLSYKFIEAPFLRYRIRYASGKVPTTDEPAKVFATAIAVSSQAGPSADQKI